MHIVIVFAVAAVLSMLTIVVGKAVFPRVFAVVLDRVLSASPAMRQASIEQARKHLMEQRQLLAVQEAQGGDGVLAAREAVKATEEWLALLLKYEADASSKEVE